MSETKKKLYRAVLYLRLSKEDGDKEESYSISNQRDLGLDYLSKHPEIKLIHTMVDDGYTGSNFQRPNFQKMIELITDGKADCVIVKDLSRFARDYVGSGYYLEKLFPAMGVRFISINDNIDFLLDDGSDTKLIMAFKNVLNDSYIRDISIKIRSQFEIKRKKGEYIGAFVVYGYKKDENDKHKLVVDKHVAEIVKNIFNMRMQGISASAIADKLNTLSVLSPAEYKKLNSNFKANLQKKHEAKWSAKAVIRILKNEIYTGTLIQGKNTTVNYKVKKVIEKDSSEWVVIPDNHEAIISKEQFDIVQKIIANDTRVNPGNNTPYLFSGFIECADCHSSLVRRSNKSNGKTYVYYMCSANKLGLGCTSHRVNEYVLYISVMTAVNTYCKNISDLTKKLSRVSLETVTNVQTQRIDKSEREKKSKIDDLQRTISVVKARCLENLETQAAPVKNDIYSVAIYVRLSVEESRYKNGTESLVNQEEIVREYVKGKENMKLYKVYSDNGETGTNFDRQGFQNMMYDVYNGKVNCIIVKDLSRFGREYIEMGDYLEKIFPLIGVRFIAVNDHYDNNVTAFDISVPIKNIINTLYAKDLSKKSAAALRIKQQNGEFIGTYAAYGYMKSAEDKHKIVIDEETAPVVKMIFEWKAEGFSYASICRKLYDMGIMPPCRYRYDKGILNDKRYAGLVFWSPGTIKSMLEKEVYIGNMVQGRRKSRFFDGKDEVKVNKDEWVVAENTHEPIISKELFYKVQDLMKNKRDKYYDNLGKYDKISNNDNIFKKKVVCGDCGTNLIRYKNAKHNQTKKAYYTYICPHHNIYPEQCGFTSVSEKDLKNVVMTSIKMQISYLSDMEKMFADLANNKEVKKKRIMFSKAMSDSLANISYIRESRIRTASDFAKGLIGEEEFECLTTDFDVQLRTETERLDEIRKKRDKFDKIISAPKWISELKKYHDSKILTRDMVEAFVDKIVLHPDKRIEIIWTYTGKQTELSSILDGGVEIA